MNFDEMTDRILDILPGASFEKDNDHQIIIYTDLFWPADPMNKEEQLQGFIPDENKS